MTFTTYRNVTDGRVREIPTGTPWEQAHADSEKWEAVDESSVDTVDPDADDDLS